MDIQSLEFILVDSLHYRRELFQSFFSLLKYQYLSLVFYQLSQY